MISKILKFLKGTNAENKLQEKVSRRKLFASVVSSSIVLTGISLKAEGVNSKEKIENNAYGNNYYGG